MVRPDAVLAGGLGGRDRLVCSLDQLWRRARMHRETGHADATGKGAAPRRASLPSRKRQRRREDLSEHGRFLVKLNFVQRFQEV